MNPAAAWRALMLYSLPFVAYLQVTAGRQLIMGNMTNSNNEWIGWSEVNSIDGVYWVVHNDSASFDGVVLLNTSMSCPSCASGSGVTDPQYTLLSPVYMITTNNCNSTISYTQQVDVIVEVFVRSNNNNISVANLSGTVGERQTQSLFLDQSAMQLIFSVTSNLNDELLSIDDVNFSNCFDSVSLTSTIPMTIESSTNFDIPTDILTSSDGLTVSRMISTSSSHFSLPASSSVMVTSITPSILVSSTEKISMFMNATINTPTIVPSSILSATIINTLDILSSTSPVLQSTTSSLSTSVTDISIISMLNTIIMSSSSSINVFTESSSFSVTATESSLPSVTTSIVMPSSFNASESDDETFFSTNVIIGIAAGGTLLIIVCLLVTCCCLCYRVRISRRNQHRYFINNNTGHKGHSSVYARERYRNKSRSAESMNGPYHYELPFVHIEMAPEAYIHSTNGDDDTIDSESEDIRHDLKGTPTSSRRGSFSTTEEPTKMTSFYPQKEEKQWSDYDDGGDSNKDETNSDIVYTNRNLVDEMCGAELPPILSLGDYEDDDNVVIVNPYNPTFYSESNPIPNKDESPRRHTTTRGNINLEALTTLESSGEYYTPKQSIPNYRRKQTPRSSAVGKNNKVIRKAKSEINLEDATKIGGASRYPRHPNKSRIDLKEATKLGHSHSDGYQYRRTHYSSNPRILDSSSSKLERLTSLNTT